MAEQPKGVCTRCGAWLYALAERLVVCEGCKKSICYREPEVQLPCCAIKYKDLYYCPVCIKSKFNLPREAFKVSLGMKWERTVGKWKFTAFDSPPGLKVEGPNLPRPLSLSLAELEAVCDGNMTAISKLPRPMLFRVLLWISEVLGRPVNKELLEKVKPRKAGRGRKGRYAILPVTSIVECPFQPRLYDELEGFVSEIRKNGILHPLIVRPKGEGIFEVVAGSRRFEAAKRVGLSKVPTFIKELSDEEAMEICLAENIHRKDLSDFEKAKLLSKMIQKYKSQTGLAEKIGKDKSWISRHIRMLELETQLPRDNLLKLTERHARAILSVEDPSARSELIRVIKDDPKISVRELQKLADKLREKIPRKALWYMSRKARQGHLLTCEVCHSRVERQHIYYICAGCFHRIQQYYNWAESSWKPDGDETNTRLSIGITQEVWVFSREFFVQEPDRVAAKLVESGALRKRTENGTVMLAITEAEAYGGSGSDPAVWRGKRGERLLGPVGFAYVVRPRGRPLFTIIAHLEGSGGGVLIRSAKVMESGTADKKGTLESVSIVGPSKVCQWLGLGEEYDGLDVCSTSSEIYVYQSCEARKVGTRPRIGVGKNDDGRPWNFFAQGEKVSKDMQWFGEKVLRYHSKEESRLGKILDELKQKGRIRSYEIHPKLPGSRLEADFKVVLEYGGDFWIELDGLSESRLADVKSKYRAYEAVKERSGAPVWVLLKSEEIYEALDGKYVPPNLVVKNEIFSCGHSRQYKVFSRHDEPVTISHRNRVCKDCLKTRERQSSPRVM